MENIQSTGFGAFGLSPQITEALTALGYLEPTQIQKEVIPPAMEGRNIAAKSRTGTGKTAAFAIPICEKIRWEENMPQALVLEPTRELALQVRDEIFHIGRKKRLKVPAVFGGFPIEKQIQTLRQKNHIVVGTPGRVMDHIRRESLKPDRISCLVIDEADLMLDMGFAEEVGQIMEAIPSGGQVLLFSATLGREVERLVGSYMPDALSILLESDTLMVEEVAQAVYESEPEEKHDKLVTLLIQENPQDCLIFCGTREMVSLLYRRLKKEHIMCGMLHGEMEQAERLKTIADFREGRFHYLIATDVAARGIDFDGISHVINYDFPTGRESFVHRVGRTGRNGKSGKAISFVGREEKKMKQMVEEYIGKKLPVLECPKRGLLEEGPFWQRQKEKPLLKAGKGAALNRSITSLSIGGGRKSKIRAVDIVGAICNIEGILAEDIGIIDIRDSLTYVEVLHGNGERVLEALQGRPIKGKIRKVRITRTR